jgi:hypothetical protein
MHNVLAGDYEYAYYTNPVIAYEPDDEYEVVVYQESPPGENSQLDCKLRSIDLVDPHNPDTSWVDGDQITSEDENLTNPNISFNADTFYLVYTGVSSDAKCIYFTYSTVTTDAKGDLELHWSHPVKISGSCAQADSASISVDGPTAYVLFNNGSSGAYFVRGDITPSNIAIPGPPLYGINPGIIHGNLCGTTTQIVSQEGDFINYEIFNAEGERVFQSSPDWGQSPSLALDAGGNATCVYTKHDSVWLATLTSDSGWSIRCLYGGSSTSRPGHPAVGIFRGAGGRTVNVAFPVWDSTSANSQVLFCQADSNHSDAVMSNTIDNFSGSWGDSCVNIQCGLTDSVWVTYGHADTVKYSSLIYSPTNQNQPGPWSTPSSVNSPLVQAMYPYCSEFGGRLYVTYLERPRIATGISDTSVVCLVSCNPASPTSWEGLTSVSACDNIARGFYPVVAGANVVAWAESTGNGCWAIKASVNDSVLWLTPTDSVSKFCSLVSDTPVANSPSSSTVHLYYTYLTLVNGDTWQERYATKDIKTTNATTNVTRYNNGRKLLITPELYNDTLISVYRTSWGAIYAATRCDNPSIGWSTQNVASGDLPALARDYQGGLWVADREQNGQQINFQYYCPPMVPQWNDNMVSAYHPADSTQLGAPSIAAAQIDSTHQNNVAAYIVYVVYCAKQTKNKSYVIFVKVNAMGQVMEVDTLDNDNLANDSFPAVSLRAGDEISVAWQKAGEVYYRTSTAAVKPGSMTKVTWSAAYNLSNTASNSVHPAVEADNDTVIVAWAEGSTPRILVVRQSAGSAFNSWGDTVNVSQSLDTACDWPTIARYDSTIIAYEKLVDTLHVNIWATVNFPTGTTDQGINLTEGSGEPCEYGHVAFGIYHDSFPVIHCLSTGILGPNHDEAAYYRYDLTQTGGGGQQSYSIFDPRITPELLTPQPNPFSHSTSIHYAINTEGFTSVRVFDLTGRTVRTLVNCAQRPGRYGVAWDRRDDKGRLLTAGVYFIRLKSPSFEQTRKAVITQ